MCNEKIITINNGSIRVVCGDITQIKTDAIVNAANKHLSHGGGVALAIARAAAGNPLVYSQLSQKACIEQLGKPYITHGEVVVTPAMNLEKLGITYVIHTVGPICNGKWDKDKAINLRKAYWGALIKGEELKIGSIAFPLISSGIYGCPKEKSLQIFIDTSKEFLKTNPQHLRDIIMVLRK